MIFDKNYSVKCNKPGQTTTPKVENQVLDGFLNSIVNSKTLQDVLIYKVICHYFLFFN